MRSVGGSRLAWDQRGPPPAPPTPSHNAEGTDGPLAPSPASVPEIPPFWVRVIILLQVCVCLTTSVLRDAGWLSASAVGHGPRGWWGRSGEEQILPALCPDTAVPFLNGEERTRVSNRNKKRFSEAFKAVVPPALAMASCGLWAGRQGHPLALLTCVLHQGGECALHGSAV